MTLLLGPSDLRPERASNQGQPKYEDFKARVQLAVRAVGKAEYREPGTTWVILPPKQGAKE
jgi:hypothetical protein